MGSSSGGTLLGLLGGLLDSDGTSSLASAVQELLAFAQADHRYVIEVRVKHDPKRAGDD